jgi:hypothetical protein
MASSIGIKIANGEFYPIMEENSSVKKRLILTTVYDNQPSVQIDLYRSMVKSMADAQYIGSLVVEKIKQRAKGEPSIEMVISSNAQGDIAAEAVDLDTSAGGEHCSLSVSIKALDEMARGEALPDFELETNEEPPSGLYSHASRIRKQRKRKFPWWIIIVLLLLCLGACWFLFFGGKDIVSPAWDKLRSQASALLSKSEARPEPVIQPEPVKPPEPEPVKQPEPVKPPEPEPVKPPEPEPVKQPEPVKAEPETPPVIAAPVAPPAPRPQPVRRRPPPPVANFKVPTTIPKEGFAYRVRYGDTLWDIADAFYRNPRLYPRIARFNNIRNPNLIISGRTIRIPPKN